MYKLIRMVLFDWPKIKLFLNDKSTYSDTTHIFADYLFIWHINKYDNQPFNLLYKSILKKIGYNYSSQSWMESFLQIFLFSK